MKDCEKEVFTRLCGPLEAQFPGIEVVDRELRVPEHFPHVSIVMADNPVRRQNLDSGDTEVTEPSFLINVHSNKTYGAKDECKEIMAFIDDLMFGMNFTRTYIVPLSNLYDATIYRLTARYAGVFDGNYFYRR